MWTLLRKDLIFNRRLLLWNYAFYLLFLPVYAALVPGVPPGVYAGFAALVCSLVPLTLVARDDKFRTATLTCSLPVTRNAVVSARYWGGGLITLLAAVGILAVGYLVPQTGFAARGLGTGPVLVVFVVAGLVQATLLPFAIRFGLSGLLVFFIATQLLGTVVFLIGLLAGVDTLRGVIQSTAALLATLRRVTGMPGFAAVLSIGVALLNLASHGLSCRLYRAREL